MVDHGLEDIEEEVVVLHHFLHGIRADDELSKRILESLGVEVSLVRTRIEVVESCLLLRVDEYHLRLSVRVASLAHSSVERNAVNPSCRIGFLNASADHSFEVDDKVEGDAVHVVAVNENYVAAPFGIVEVLYIHVLLCLVVAVVCPHFLIIICEANLRIKVETHKCLRGLHYANLY